jgi:hypothetical protein
LRQALFAPRQAAAATAAAKAYSLEPVPSDASWDKIAANFSELDSALESNHVVEEVPARERAPQPTWSETRESLGLTVHQAVASSVSKLLLWH